MRAFACAAAAAFSASVFFGSQIVKNIGMTMISAIA